MDIKQFNNAIEDIKESLSLNTQPGTGMGFVVKASVLRALAEFRFNGKEVVIDQKNEYLKPN
ncbi:hypothetical protein [Alicyclobacillus macrosporangiidus]|uniref:Uncharacterized protein n=1 Tax=Alicyclobacillus macrosporangiidus TaxID=392015 RepID=A0A1I7KBQ1_9BACL|nr:hypothetical protein [Alicyclobacillus macrosporangiidus]SFU94829.1 hypothetical protein SAMN05421543_1157 [Alicyclobacillus macrosporangiidus]